MDMSSTDMGMSMDTGTNLFQDGNMALARAYWYIIVGVLALLFTVRAVNYVQRRIRSAVATPSHPRSS